MKHIRVTGARRAGRVAGEEFRRFGRAIVATVARIARGQFRKRRKP